jgi:hypothetical protein
MVASPAIWTYYLYERGRMFGGPSLLGAWRSVPGTARLRIEGERIE